MEAPVADAPNNWVEMSKTNSGKYFAEIGKKTFAVEITTSLRDGNILAATMDNPVSVLGRERADRALTDCAKPNLTHPTTNRGRIPALTTDAAGN